LFRLDLYRRAGEVETEFMTLMWFTDHEAIVRFAGPDWETAVDLSDILEEYLKCLSPGAPFQ
jgi:hypothetical protein